MMIGPKNILNLPNSETPNTFVKSKKTPSLSGLQGHVKRTGSLSLSTRCGSCFTGTKTEKIFAKSATCAKIKLNIYQFSLKEIVQPVILLSNKLGKNNFFIKCISASYKALPLAFFTERLFALQCSTNVAPTKFSLFSLCNETSPFLPFSLLSLA
jgi:hypothetical protein